MDLLLLAPVAGLVSLAFAAMFASYTLKQDSGSAKMNEIAGAIQEGAAAYLNRQYRTVAVVAVIIAVILFVALSRTMEGGYFDSGMIAIGFLAGAVCSAVAGYIGMFVSTRANVRVAQAASSGVRKALTVAFRGGAVTGLAVVGLALLGTSVFYMIFGGGAHAVDLVVGYGFGASLISLFARIGGGIYTKAADVGADLVGKVEAGIPEDDPRNAGVIADNVGDNVGDCAGMGADLFETYVVTAIAAMLIGSLIAGDSGLLTVFPGITSGLALIEYPLILGAVAIFASIIAIFAVKMGARENIMSTLYKGVITAAVLSIILFYPVTMTLIGADPAGTSIFISAVIGIIIMALMVIVTEYYTQMHSPVKAIADASQTGAGTNLIAGLAVGMMSVGWPVLIICGGILAAYLVPFVVTGTNIAGLYGISIAAVAMLSTTGIIVALDSYGPITDNAGGIAEMADLPPEVRDTTDKLDAVGNTTKAVTKGYAVASAAMAALALFSDYLHRVGLPADEFSLFNPLVLVGLLIGGLLPFIFSSVMMRAVGKGAFKVVEEVRRQFKEIPGIWEGTAKPEYGKCVDIVTAAALREMLVPGMIAVVVPLVVGFLFGAVALGGLLIGVIISGLMLALMMSNGGAAWDNAKKLIEDGYLGGKGSEAHKAAVVGDTVGDPFKDTAGPAINPLIKAMNMIAILFSSMFVAYGLLPM
ncbi:K(+)-stimulated pyrophosphate-energized sodium pump [Candidatus Methanophagaceae archaeon]|nr:K(+)-stimulated pyrophosphate-energized sodium pump [Methanophagales archaeon]